VVGGYTPNATSFEPIFVGYYERRKLHFAGKVRAWPEDGRLRHSTFIGIRDDKIARDVRCAARGERR
jgi:ATP-dependent DNA ligase